VFKIHPSKDILGAKSRILEGKKVALGICGSVAASRAPELARDLMRNGAEVIAVMTEAACRLISPELMEWATGNPAVISLTGKIEHVQLGNGGEGSADVVLIAPATANTVGKIAHGIDDTPVTSLATTAIGAGLPVVVAPAMHETMFRHPAVSENLERLRSMGVRVVMPDLREGKAKLPENGVIVEAVVSALTKKSLAGVGVLVTAGPTRSHLDAVRYLTNSSSGRMGVEIAKEAAARGASVTLVAGSMSVPWLGEGIEVVSAPTTEEMLSSVVSRVSGGGADLLVLAAAPVDFSFSVRGGKASKFSSDSQVEARLEPLPKISREARKASPSLFIIGFKAEHGVSEEELISRAKGRLLDSGMDLIAANDLAREGSGFRVETNEVYLIDKGGLMGHFTTSPKREIARKILDAYEERRASIAGR